MVKKKSVKISIPMCIYETITENARSSGFSTEEYMNYLAYKDNFLHLSIQSLHKEKQFHKFYNRYRDEVDEKNAWEVMFNIG